MPAVHFDFPHEWRVYLLQAPPMIAPARSFVYPQKIAGEEDALARGAMLIDVHPASGGNFLATCALGFEGDGPLSGVWSCPNPAELCAVAGGYVYLIDTRQPQRCTHLALRPVVDVRAVTSHALLLFVGFHSIVAWGAHGLAWESPRVSSEGITLGAIEGDRLHGLGWDLMTDKEVAFVVDLRSGAVL